MSEDDVFGVLKGAVTEGCVGQTYIRITLDRKVMVVICGKPVSWEKISSIDEVPEAIKRIHSLGE